jgi:pyrroloquinoline quinone biosynthesis protein B
VRIKVLGAAAGGGLPQWNCACENCSALRRGSSHIQPRTQSQLAITAGEDGWFLINASPDLREQLNRTSEIHPDPATGLRNTPVEGVILTSADLDHVLGLLFMREFTPVRVYASGAVRSILQSNSFFQMLDRLPGQSRWTTIEPQVSFSLGGSVTCTPIALPGSLPSYVAEKERIALDAARITMGLLFETSQGKRFAYLPALSSVSSVLKDLLSTCSVLLVDGTFWKDDELQSIQPGTPLARSMGHMPISGADGSLSVLGDLAGVRRIYTHINNTNPILNESSRERRAVHDAGWEVAWDGLEITV